MATILEYAKLAAAVYDDAPQVDGWTRVKFKKAVSGIWEGDAFQGAAYTQGADMVFAFKGTAGGQDLIADVKLGVGMNTAQFNNAGNFVRKTEIHQGTNVSICGHSLGGAIAQIVGNRQKLPFVTFNAPGVAIMSRNIDQMAFATLVGTGHIRIGMSLVSAIRHPGQLLQDIGSMFYFVKGVNFRLGKDVVGNIGVHYGKVIEIPYQGGSLDVKAKHSIGAMVAALKGSEYETLKLADLV